MPDGCRLWIVHDEHVVVIRQHLRALTVVFEICSLCLLRQAQLCTLQCIMKTFGYGEEVLVAIDQAPVGGNSQSKMHGNDPAQQFGHSTAGGSGIYVADPHPLQFFAKFANLVGQSVANPRPVIFQVHGF